MVFSTWKLCYICYVNYVIYEYKNINFLKNNYTLLGKPYSVPDGKQIVCYQKYESSIELRFQKISLEQFRYLKEELKAECKNFRWYIKWKRATTCF